MARSAGASVPELRKRNRLGAAALLVVTGTLTVLTACSSDESTSSAPKASPTPSVSQPSKPVNPAETAKREALDAYARYWDELQLSYAKASTEGTDITKYAAGVALVQAEQDAKEMQKVGQVMTGSVRVGSPTVTRLDADREVPNAKISSCLDISRWDVVDRKTKKKAVMPSGRLTKYVIVGTIERWPDGWKVIKDEPQEGKPC